MSKRPLARARSPFHWHLSPMVVGSSKLTHLIIFRTDAMESGESDSSDADSERDGYAIGSDGEDDPQVRVAYTCLAATSATQPLQQFRPVNATFLNFTFLVFVDTTCTHDHRHPSDLALFLPKKNPPLFFSNGRCC